jgi:ribose 5-phosphate isomerase B
MEKLVTIAIGADHRGFILKKYLLSLERNLHIRIAWHDVGTYDEDRTDYPIYAQRVSLELIEKRAELGVLICGSGVGIAIAANRFKHIFAAVAWNVEVATSAKTDDGCNVLVLPADFINEQGAVQMVIAWLHATFKRGIYKERIDMIDGTV